MRLTEINTFPQMFTQIKESETILQSSVLQYNPVSTTSVLTATILTYANRAGITAGAGTRLVLYLFLVKVFKLFSFQ